MLTTSLSLAPALMTSLVTIKYRLTKASTTCFFQRRLEVLSPAAIDRGKKRLTRLAAVWIDIDVTGCSRDGNLRFWINEPLSFFEAGKFGFGDEADVPLATKQLELEVEERFEKKFVLAMRRWIEREFENRISRSLLSTRFIIALGFRSYLVTRTSKVRVYVVIGIVT